MRTTRWFSLRNTDLESRVKSHKNFDAMPSYLFPLIPAIGSASFTRSIEHEPNKLSASEYFNRAESPVLTAIGSEYIFR
jgi:hypothetical protein